MVMIKGPVRWAFSGICVLALAHAPYASGPGQELAVILDKCAGYCDGLRQAALDFVCREVVREDIFNSVPFKGRNRYRIYAPNERLDLTYDYQMIQRAGLYAEKRTLVEDSGRAVSIPDAPLKTKRLYSLRSFFGPLGLVGRDAQPSYEYRLIKKERILGYEAVLIEFRPKPNPMENSDIGRLWVDPIDGSVLRIEFNGEGLAGYRIAADAAERRGLRADLRAVHDYGIVKNGLRFPSRTMVEESYTGSMVPKFTRSRLSVGYSDYRFFTVEFEVKHDQGRS